MFLALSVWKGAAELLFVVYGQNPLLGQFLREKVARYKSGIGVRSTQSVPISKLVNDFGMKIYAVNKTPNELYNLLQLKNGCRNIKRSDIIPITSHSYRTNDDYGYSLAAEKEIEYKVNRSLF